MAKLNEFAAKDALEIRDDVLRTIKNGLIKQGVANPYVGPNSDWFVTATALGNELAVVGANCIVRGDAQMPDTATGTDLDREGALIKREKQPAAGSVGPVVIEASATSPIETGRELTDAAGLRFKVSIGGNYADGASVPIEAIDVGDATNHAEGDVLQWSTAPPFCSNNVTVGDGGLVNGIDAEDDETFRARIFAVYQNPPGAGDWEHAAEIAEESTSSVQKAFVYPALQGPSTTFVAVAAAPTATNKSRVVAAATMSGVVSPYVKGKLPKPAEITVTTVADLEVDIAIGISIPEAPTASPPGPGGGWSNGTPWPKPDGTTFYRATVGSVTSTTVFSILANDGTTASVPTAGVTRISWFSPYEWKLYSALITSFTGDGIASSLVVTIDQPFVGLTAGSYIFPECQNAQTYLDAILAQFALMGPGEKTSNLSALVRGFRHPIPAAAWPNNIGPALLREVVDSGEEILSAHYFHRTASGPGTILGPSGSLTASLPGGIDDAPNIFIPRHLGLYRIP